jgi:hypothetical protein
LSNHASATADSSWIDRAESSSLSPWFTSGITTIIAGPDRRGPVMVCSLGSTFGGVASQAT